MIAAAANIFWRFSYRKTPKVLQFEDTECGAACLKIILAHYGSWHSLEELRSVCNVSRSGSSALDLVKAAQSLGAKSVGRRVNNLADLANIEWPCILHWEFNHFVVLEHVSKHGLHINDPASGHRTVSFEEADTAFTGGVITVENSPNISKSSAPSLIRRLRISSYLPQLSVGAAFAATSLLLMFVVFASPLTLSYLIESISESDAETTLRTVAAFIAVSLVLHVLVFYLQAKLRLDLETFMVLKSTSHFLDHLFAVVLNFFMQRNATELANRVFIDRRFVSALYGDLLNLSLQFFILLCSCLLLFVLNVQLAFISLASVAFSTLLAIVFWGARLKISQQLLQSESQLIGLVASSFTQLQQSRMFSDTSKSERYSASLQSKVTALRQQLSLNMITSSNLVLLATGLATSFILYQGAYFVILGELSLGNFAAFNMLSAYMFASVNSLFAAYLSIQTLVADSERIQDCLGAASHDMTETKSENFTQLHTAPSNAVVLENVSFSWSKIEEPILSNISLTIEEGENVAVIGHSGSGKSTLAKIICGLIKPTSGTLLLNEAIGTSKIAYVDQEVTVFPTSVRNNITLWDQHISDEEVIKAAKICGLHNAVTLRDEGYETDCTNMSAGFSSGELQRLAIARAIVTKPTLLVLDEATAYLDFLSEAALLDRIANLGTTTLTITHRPLSVKAYPKLVLMNSGHIDAIGSYHQLTSQDDSVSRLLKSELVR